MKIYDDGSHPAEGFKPHDVVQHIKGGLYLTLETLASGNMVRTIELDDDLNRTGVLVLLPRSHCWLLARRDPVDGVIRGSAQFMLDCLHRVEVLLAGSVQPSDYGATSIRDLEQRLIARALYAGTHGDQWAEGLHGQQLREAIDALNNAHKVQAS